MVCVLSKMVSVMVRAGGLALRWVNARMRGSVCGAWSRVCGAVGCAFTQPAGLTGAGVEKRHNKIPEANASGIAGGSDRRRSGDLSIFSRTLYQLSYRAKT